MPRLPTPLTLPERKHNTRAGHGHADRDEGITSGPAPSRIVKRPMPGPWQRRLRGEQATAWIFVSPSVLIILGLSVVP